MPSEWKNAPKIKAPKAEADAKPKAKPKPTKE